MGQYRIVVPTLQDDTPAPPPKSHDLGQKIKAAVACGFFVSLGSAIAWSVFTIPGRFWEAWAWGMAGCAVVGFAVTSYFGFRWSRNVADRDWRLEDRDRNTRRKLEEAQQKAAEAAIESAKQGTPDARGAPTPKGDRLHVVAMQWFLRHYTMNLPTTRDAMTEDGVCTQPEWNYVNQTMKAVGLKKNNKMRADLPFEVAVSEWWANVDIREDGYIWTQNGKGQWKALVELK